MYNGLNGASNKIKDNQKINMMFLIFYEKYKLL